MIVRAAFLAVLLTPIAARAQTTAAAPDAGATPAPAAESAQSWYGWQTLSVDGAALAVGIASGFLDKADKTDTSTVLLYASLAAYALGAPAVHLAHQRPLVGLADAGMRVGLPIALAASLYAVGPKCTPGDGGHDASSACLLSIVEGLTAGIAAAIIIDAAALAHETVPSRDPVRTGVHVSVAPTVSSNQAGLTVLGSF